MTEKTPRTYASKCPYDPDLKAGLIAKWPKGVDRCLRCDRSAQRIRHGKRSLCESCYWKCHEEGILDVFPRGNAPSNLVKLLCTHVGAQETAAECERQRRRAVLSAGLEKVPPEYREEVSSERLLEWANGEIPKPFRKVLRRYLLRIGRIEVLRNKASDDDEPIVFKHYELTSYDELMRLSPGIDPFSEMRDGNSY